MRLQEHCLVGLRGQVKRGPDNHIVHTNFDTDVIVSEEPPLGSTMKPDELYSLIERFAMGRCVCCGTQPSRCSNAKPSCAVLSWLKLAPACTFILEACTLNLPRVFAPRCSTWVW